jgi:hypothetical protein
MKLLYIATARSIWILSLQDLNPRGQAITQESIDRITDKYKFQSPPTVTSAIEAQKKNEPVHFVAGSFPSSAGVDVAVDLKVYNDGLLADCRSNTRDSDSFLADVLAWLPEGLALPKADISIRKKMYVSEMIVESDELLALVNPKLSGLAQKLSSLIPRGSPTSYEVSSLALATDPKDGTPLINFKFERQANMSFDQHRYYTSAPIHTDDHWRLLKDLEAILSE